MDMYKGNVIVEGRCELLKPIHRIHQRSKFNDRLVQYLSDIISSRESERMVKCYFNFSFFIFFTWIFLFAIGSMLHPPLGPLHLPSARPFKLSSNCKNELCNMLVFLGNAVVSWSSNGKCASVTNTNSRYGTLKNPHVKYKSKSETLHW